MVTMACRRVFQSTTRGRASNVCPTLIRKLQASCAAENAKIAIRSSNPTKSRRHGKHGAGVPTASASIPPENGAPCVDRQLLLRRM
jgi:hypothetical protein